MWTARTRVFCGTGRPLPGNLARARAERRERLVVVVGAACASAGSEHGVWVLQATASKLRVPLRWRRRFEATRRCRRSTSAVRGSLARVYFAGMGGRSPGTSRERGRRRERLVVMVGAACASAGSAHGVVSGAGNDIQDKGAVALAAALQGNTTLQTLDLSSVWTARTRVFCGNGGPLPGDLASACGQ
jgi:hypothetical protein